MVAKKASFRLICVLFGVTLSLILGELLFRVLEYRRDAQHTYLGKGGHWVSDSRWGWKPDQGPYRIKTDEFEAIGEVNSLNMNDVPYVPEDDAGRTRVLVLGDSHTYATGVSLEQTWPKVLERKLNDAHGTKKVRVYNGGVTGFNMHQYLLRLTDQGPLLRPHYVVIGLSYATDLYDLLPADRGGWIYGSDRERDYFDFNPSGELVELHWSPSSQLSGSSTNQITGSQRARALLEYSAVFRYLRRSKLALFIGSHIKIGGQTLWPNMEVVVESEVAPHHQYQWRLFEALLSRIKEEAERQNAQLVVVGIPYIAQVYDEIWEISFGRDPRFSRTAAIERVSSYCKLHGIVYVDTLTAFRQRSEQLGRWLHYRRDAHPTVEGQELIADEVVKTASIRPIEQGGAQRQD